MLGLPCAASQKIGQYVDFNLRKNFLDTIHPDGLTMPNRIRLAAFAAALLAPGLAHAAQTIVGTWAPDPRECTPVGGMVSIQPLGLMMGDEFACTFHDVSRSGEVVTWHGGCGGPEQPTRRSTVIAERRGALLYVRLNGAQNGPYLRCNPSN